MFKIKNLHNNRIVKDAVTRAVVTFATKEEAEQFATSLQRNAIASDKRAKFVVIPA